MLAEPKSENGIRIFLSSPMRSQSVFFSYSPSLYCFFFVMTMSVQHSAHVNQTEMLFFSPPTSELGNGPALGRRAA